MVLIRGGCSLCPEVISAPLSYFLLDVLLRERGIREHLPHEVRQLVVGCKAQRDEMRGSNVADPRLQVGGKHARQAQAFLETDEAILRAQHLQARHASGGDYGES